MSRTTQMRTISTPLGMHPLYNYSEEPVVQLRLSLNHAGSQIHEKQRDKAKGKASWRAAGGRAVYTSSYHEKATAHYDSLHRRDFHFLRAHWKASARNQSAGTRCGRKHEGVACCAKSEQPQRRCAHLFVEARNFTVFSGIPTQVTKS